MTTSVEERIWAALRARVLTMALTGAPPVAWPNMPFPESGGEKPPVYLDVRHFANRITRRFMKGSNPHQRQGILQVLVRTPLNEGTETADKLSGEIAAHFPAGLALFEEGTKVTIKAAPDVSSYKGDDDVSWVARASIRYECFA